MLDSDAEDSLTFEYIEDCLESYNIITMDYTKIPRSLIYKERDNLNDFGVKNPGTINHELFLNLKEIYMATDRQMELMLRCFNNAYYICTVIPLEDFPDIRVSEYEQLLLKDDAYDREEVCALSMAMVAKMMQAYDERWKNEDSDLIKAIQHRLTHFQWMHMGASESFTRMMDKHNTDGLFLPLGEFAPRDITEAIESVPERYIWFHKEFIRERLESVKDSRKRIHGIDMAIARLNDDLKRIDPNNNLRGAYKKAIDYYAELYEKQLIDADDNYSCQPKAASPTSSTVEQDTEIGMLKKQLEQNKKWLTDKIKENAVLKEKVAELSEPVELLTAEQKIRMEFTLQLLKRAGVTDEVLKKRGNKQKAATILSLLLDIKNNNKRGNEAQTCAVYISDRRYYPQRDNNRELIKRLNDICTELGLDIRL